MKNAGFHETEILRSLFFLFKKITFAFPLGIKLLIPFKDVAPTAYFVSAISTDSTSIPNIRVAHVAITTDSFYIRLCQFSPFIMLRFCHNSSICR